jgi:2-succinyl-6-hydroxy-2,4-cyclohexadiene-1-carboxylate synthase
MDAEVHGGRSGAAGPGALAHRTAGAGPRVVLVHGFAQTGECLGPLGDALEQDRTVVRVDNPGHGSSLEHRDADLREGARLLVRAAGTGVYIGYSMGARLCLHAALQAPRAIRAMVLIGGTAGIIDDAEREARRREDEELARRIERHGVEAFLTEWLALPMFAGLPEWARFDDERRRNTAEGLAASLRNAGTGAMAPLWDRLQGIHCPVLCLSGELDERYGRLAGRLVDAFGGVARHEVVPGAGHAAHLENPEATTRAVRSFLAELR